MGAALPVPSSRVRATESLDTLPAAPTSHLMSSASRAFFAVQKWSATTATPSTRLMTARTPGIARALLSDSPLLVLDDALPMPSICLP